MQKKLKRLKSKFSWWWNRQSVLAFRRSAERALRRGAGMRDLVNELDEIAGYKDRQDFKRFFNSPEECPELYSKEAYESQMG